MEIVLLLKARYNKETQGFDNPDAHKMATIRPRPADDRGRKTWYPGNVKTWAQALKEDTSHEILSVLRCRASARRPFFSPQAQPVVCGGGKNFAPPTPGFGAACAAHSLLSLCMGKGRSLVTGTFLFSFSFQWAKFFPRCGRPFSSGGGGRAAGRPGPQLRRRSHQGAQKSGGEERGHPSPFDNNIGSRRASTRTHKAKPAAVLTASRGSSGTFDENMLDSGTEIKHSET